MPSNIRRTICVGGYSDKQRPPSYRTKEMERRAAVRYRIADFDPDAFEGDHLIPISIGGSPEKTERSRTSGPNPGTANTGASTSAPARRMGSNATSTVMFVESATSG
jgi:hypothetical protein